jgi:hypothetical protein
MATPARVACASLDVTKPRRPLTLWGPPPAKRLRGLGSLGTALGAAAALLVTAAAALLGADAALGSALTGAAG